MKVLVTSGGTIEHIDDVRVLTNISTGKLGAKIAHTFALGQESHDVTYVHAQGAVIPRCNLVQMRLVPITNVASLVEVMMEEVPKHDLVIHAMAVSDFSFRRDNALKLKSNDPEGFIDYLRANIEVTPKVLSMIKIINPNVKLVGFKFEVGKTPDELKHFARQLLLRNSCDLVIANDKQEMEKEKQHIAYAVYPDGRAVRLSGKNEIASYLYDWS